MTASKVELELGGRTLSIETGKLAKQADGSAVIRFGETVVLGTAVRSTPREARMSSTRARPEPFQ